MGVCVSRREASQGFVTSLYVGSDLRALMQSLGPQRRYRGMCLQRAEVVVPSHAIENGNSVSQVMC